MKRSNRLVILVGVLLAVLAFVGIVVLLGNKTAGPGTTAKTTVPVLVAKQDIALGDPVTPAMVVVKEVSPDAVSGTRYADPSQMTGRPALYPVSKDQQVSQEVFGATGNYCITCQLQPGEKAIAFQVDRVTGLDFLVQPGDHIDIVYEKDITPAQPTVDSVGKPNPRFEPITGLADVATVKTLLQNKRVLYVSATKIKPAANPSATPAPGTQTTTEAPIESVIIVFAGTDADAEVIKFAQTDFSVTGPLTAILRNSKDDKQETTAGVTLKLLVDTFGIPIPEIILPPVPTTAP